MSCSLNLRNRQIQDDIQWIASMRAGCDIRLTGGGKAFLFFFPDISDTDAQAFNRLKT